MANPPLFRHQVANRPPAFKKLEEIRNMEKNRNKEGGGLSGVWGITEPNFRFVHDAKAWKHGGTPALPTWQFNGTAVVLEVAPQVFLPSEYQKDSSILQPIKNHEQLHVEDAAQIVRKALPEELKKDATFKKYYLDRAPIPDGTYAEMIPKGISAIVRSTFNQLWNAKVAALDTPARYKPVIDAVDAAIRKQHP